MSWQPAGNIKGPSGTAVIPDPLVINNAAYWGTDLRITKTTGGGKVEVRSPTSGAWSLATEWTSLPVGP